jgi:hypothetical protein
VVEILAIFQDYLFDLVVKPTMVRVEVEVHPLEGMAFQLHVRVPFNYFML